MDQALTRVSNEETESLMLFTHSASAREAVKHARKIAALLYREVNSVGGSALLSSYNVSTPSDKPPRARR
jgi:hypothetical protein